MIIKIIVKFSENLMKVFTESFFDFCWVCRRVRIIYILSLITFFFVWRKYKGDIRLRASFLIISVIFIETVLRFHAYSEHYQMYVDGLLFATMAYYLVRISKKSSATARKALAVFSLVFAGWFWIDDINRKMLWPTFAPHIGEGRPQIERMPLIADRFVYYSDYWKDLKEKIKTKELPEGTLPPWLEDNRTFLWTKEPWRRWNDKQTARQR